MRHLDKQNIQQYLPDISINLFETIDSTNTYARTLVGKQEFPFLVISESQTAGRGRGDHTFYSPQDGIYYTLVVENTDNLLPQGLITVASVVALWETVSQVCDISCKIKWVNDLYLNNKKVAGILCEAPTIENYKTYIIGIGLNVSNTSFPDELKDKATSLNLPNLDRNTFVGNLTKKILFYINRENIEKMMSIYRENSLVLGKKVSFKINDSYVEGIAKEINDEGNLIVESDQIYTLNSGEISLIDWQ